MYLIIIFEYDLIFEKYIRFVELNVLGFHIQMTIETAGIIIIW